MNSRINEILKSIIHTINTNTTFLNCSKLYSTIPEEALWNDKQVIWSPTKTFNGCSDEIRAQVPKSLGGTALDDII